MSNKKFAYYNENDPKAASWLKELIRKNLIAPGVVDSRSVEDITPNEIKEYQQHHFFAGIGVWSYALRSAGWPDDRPVWTGSCPCQPFSAAGQGKGFADERHLWPAWFHLIRECAPSTVFGEQVANKPGLAWFDLVQTDMEDAGYAIGTTDLCAAGVGAPHIRQRLWFVAERMANSVSAGRSEWRTESSTRCGQSSGVADSERHDGRTNKSKREKEKRTPSFRDSEIDAGQTNPTNGFWRDADWLRCRDGKFRPVEPGSFPLANGSAARVGLRGYGNAINAEVAKAFIKTYMEIKS